MSKTLKRIASHILVWIVVMATTISMSLHPGRSFSFTANLPVIVTYLFLICFFYLNADYLFVRFVPNKKYLLYALIVGAILLLYIFFHNRVFSFFFQSDFLGRPPFPRYGAQVSPFPAKENQIAPFPTEGSPVPPFVPGGRGMISAKRIILPLTQFLSFWVISLSYRLMSEWAALSRRNKEIEVEKSMIELAYLKAQINPHFILNTVNTIYSLVLKQSDKATDAILLYSQVVRYLFDKIDTDFVPLQEEVTYINNYIDLQIMRFTDTLQVDFEVEGEIENRQIAPLTFISFIENYFKYGVSNHYPSVISIRIKTDGKAIYFSTRNRKYKKKDAQYKGRSIGLENTKRKLNLIYPGRHTLAINENDDSFYVDLIILDRPVLGKES